MNIDFTPIKTRIIKPPKDEVWDILDGLPKLEENDILFITSKIMAIHQGRCVRTDDAKKVDLIKQEASLYLPYRHPSGFDINLSATQDVLIPAAGIDESNADGHYILWPKDIDAFCREIRTRLCKKHGLKNLGVVSTDSHTTPLRWGVTGIAIGLAGVEPLKDCRGQKDLFGRKINLTQINQVDALASMAVLLMGETDECTPLVLLRGYAGIAFNEGASMKDFKIPVEQDLYSPLLSVMKKPL